MIDWIQWARYQKALTPWQWAAVIVVLSLAIWSIVRLKSFFREDAEDADSTLEMLTQFRDLHQEGGLSDDEFRLIKSRLSHSAQMALVAEQKKSKPDSVEIKRSISTESSDDPAEQSPPAMLL